MAQQDTGLGWSAEADWLTQAGSLTVATLKEAGGPSFVGQPIPYATSPQEAVAMGEYWVYDSLYFNNPRYEFYAFSKTEGAEIFVANVNNLIFCMSTTERAVVATARKDKSGGDITQYAQTTLTGHDNTTGLWYSNLNTQGNITQDHCNPNLLWASTVREALDAIIISESAFTKTNPGYAVACVAKWKTGNGTELISPILISSNTEFVDMATTGTGNYMAKFNKLLSGTRFYMAFWDITGDKTLLSSFQQIDLTERGNMDLEQLFMTIISTSYAHVIIINSPDPYEQEGGESEEDGGDGEDVQNDDIDFTPAPTSMAVASGFITLFCPSQYELNALADYMWGPLFDVDTLKKLFANPMDCILGLSVIPVPIVPEGTKTVKVGGVSTTVSMGYTNHQYYPVDCGTVTIPKRWGAYMDYSPYTKLNIFLPYIGFRQISADDVMGKTLHLRYMIDILSGACNAELKVNNTVLYSWAGSCAMQIPITGNDWRSAITAGVSIAGSVAATVLSGGASAPMIAGTVASATVNSLALKPEVQRSGAISSASGFLAAQRPYIVRTNPRNAIPANQNKYSGYPSFVTVSLGSLTGYNEVYSVHLENIPATGAELDEIETILKGGAIF